MINTSITQNTPRLIAQCSLALLIAAGGGAAFAHGGGSHNGGDRFSDGAHGRCVDCGGGNGDVSQRPTNYFGDRSVDSNYWRHHHHHHGSGPGGLGAVHGPGSSHNPIVYHPPVRPVRAPIAGVGPAKLPKLGPNLTFCDLQQAGVNVRDHRSTPGPCRHYGGHH